MRYEIIYADPPWRYEHAISNSRKIENQYNTMELEDIKKLNIPSAENSILYLWVPAPKVTEGIEVMKAWGFNYRTCAVWDKQVLGMGYWFRNQHELLFVGVKGEMSPPKNIERISSVFCCKRGEHSSKPDYIKVMIEKWYPELSKLELFARDNTPLLQTNWHRWGNEVESDVRLDS